MSGIASKRLAKGFGPKPNQLFWLSLGSFFALTDDLRDILMRLRFLTGQVRFIVQCSTFSCGTFCRLARYVLLLGALRFLLVRYVLLFDTGGVIYWWVYFIDW